MTYASRADSNSVTGVSDFQNIYSTLGKRGLDIFLALVILPFVVPVILVLWCCVRLDGGPGLFGHTRVGQHGKKFRCWKLRSMVPDAERILGKHLLENPEAAAAWARDRKLPDDPRITRIGGFLRRTSLDELPQLWNVLCGDMSFVGPRPVPADELSYYGKHAYAYLALRPGITGIWQVCGRNDVKYSSRVLMDVIYLRKMALWFDMGLILRTTLVVVRPTGR